MWWEVTPSHFILPEYDQALLLLPGRPFYLLSAFQVPAQQPVDHVHQLQGEVCGNGDDLLLYLYMPALSKFLASLSEI